MSFEKAWRRRRSPILGLAAAPICACWIAAMVSSIPARDAVGLATRGEAALMARHWTDAESAFVRVLELAPDSGRARRGLACLLWAQGQHSTAAVQLMLAMQDGLPLSSAASCGKLGSFAHRFTRHVAGIATVFALPRAATAAADEARALRAPRTPAVTTDDRPADAQRLMTAGCLAWRAGYIGLGFQLSRLAGLSYGAGRDELDRFLACVGPRRSSAIRCSAHALRLPQCAFDPNTVRALRRDERLGAL